MLRLSYLFPFALICFISCSEHPKLNNRKSFNNNLPAEAPIINTDGSIGNPEELKKQISEGLNGEGNSPTYFDPKTGLLNPDFQEIDLNLSKENSSDKSWQSFPENDYNEIGAE